MNSRPNDGAPSSENPDQLNELSERAALALAHAALEGLVDMTKGRLLEDSELDQALAVVSPQPRLKD
ncbi:hypothetical protein [Paucibacter sp. B51]|uniref:hypothetical protein n=1 Tax=Paucibacter sp. B51 TaxID=2993315 RepID=UPI0022EBF950|nr:hypothetical protein [Paucibacter sp. B51]